MSQRFFLKVSDFDLKAICPNPNASFQYFTMFDQTEGLTIRDKNDRSIHQINEGERAHLAMELLIEILGWHSATIDTKDGWISRISPLSIRTLLLPEESQRILESRILKLKTAHLEPKPFDSTIRSMRPDDLIWKNFKRRDNRSISSALKMDSIQYPWWNPRF